VIDGTLWRGWLRRCATSREVVGSIPDGVNGIFYWYDSSNCTMTLWLTQPLRETSARNISWGMKTGAQGWQPYHLHVPIFLNSGSLDLLVTSGPVQVCKRDWFTFTFTQWQRKGRVQIYLCIFLTSDLDEVEWLPSRCGWLTLRVLLLNALRGRLFGSHNRTRLFGKDETL
jgi:hypothetical protein